jgi:hypothetical protein
VTISIWRLIGSLFLLVLLGFCLWIYNRIEYIDQEISTGFQGAAARNPLLAAGRLAEHYGAAAHYVPAYSKPPRSAATLLFTAPRYHLSEGQNDALLNWVETTGGHLIIVPQPLQDRGKDMRTSRKEDTFQDPFLNLLNISVEYLSTESDKKRPPNIEKSPVEHDSDEAIESLQDLLRQIGRLNRMEPQAVELPDGTQLKARFNPRLRLNDLVQASDWRIVDPIAKSLRNKGDYGLSYVQGKGRITVLASLDFINNDMIGVDDDAALFVTLVSLAKGQDIWFVYGSNVPALWRWFVDHAWTVLIAAALLLIVWLWMISRRFGPLLPARSVARRSIVEHVAASARYLWRGKQGQALYQTLCDDFYKRAYLRYPQWSCLSVQELSHQIVLFAHETRIPQLSGLTERNVEYLLNTNHPRNKRQFAINSYLLDVLRNKL